MDAVVEKQQRMSRWSRDPVLSASGAPIVVHPTERDIEIFKLLGRFDYLPADCIHAFVGGSEKALRYRLNLLSRKPNLYLSRPDQQRHSADANCRPLIYELDERGARMLRDRGLPCSTKTYRRNFAHELMVAQITASIELGTRENPNIRLITWPEILASEKTPKGTREASNPASIPVSYSLRGQFQRGEVVADGRPFGLERTIEGKRSYLFFPGVEADCATEPLDASAIDRSSIAKKFAAYAAVVEQGIYSSHFGFPNFLVPFITTNITRMDSMMELLNRLAAGRGSEMFLFKTLPAFTSSEKPPAPSGHMLTVPWQRVGFPPLSLIE
jgi:Replication-relaxation